jgi:hypothetical protein
MNACRAGAAPAYWYWAHIHAGAVYRRQPNGVRCRCLGHGGIPWGHATLLDKHPNVLWFEDRNAGDPDNELRVWNGCVVLKLQGGTLLETFLDENGGAAWTSSQAAGVDG